MGYVHNPTCGCAECGNYGQPYNPNAIHNQSCGCARCGNYPNARSSGGHVGYSANSATVGQPHAPGQAGTQARQEGTESITIEVPTDVAAWFKAQGAEAQPRMAAALRIYADAHRGG
jgi:uncharacterized protein (DUF4415 family)